MNETSPDRLTSGSAMVSNGSNPAYDPSADPDNYRHGAKWTAKRQLDGQAAADQGSDHFLLHRGVLQAAIDAVRLAERQAKAELQACLTARDEAIRSLTKADRDMRHAAERHQLTSHTLALFDQSVEQDQHRWNLACAEYEKAANA